MVALFLGFVVSVHGGRNITNRTFVWIAVSSLAWTVFNYFSLALTDPHQVVVVIKMLMVAASFLSAFILLFAIVFPKEKSGFPVSLWILICLGISAYSVLGYYVWYDVANGSADPAPSARDEGRTRHRGLPSGLVLLSKK